MRWTVWQRRSTCANCGARITVPATGLVMTCEYCGEQSPVPDIAERQARERSREAAPAPTTAVPATAAPAQSVPSRSETRRTPRRRSFGFLYYISFCALMIAVLHLTGNLTPIIEVAVGDPGTGRLAAAGRRLTPIGFAPAGKPVVARYIDSCHLYLELKKGSCYALVIGSGRPIRSVSLTDPSGRSVGRHTNMRYDDSMVHCPRLDGVYRAHLVLDSPGRYSWILYRGPLRHRLPEELRADAVGAWDAAPTKDKPSKQGRRHARRRRPHGSPAVTPAEAADGNQHASPNGSPRTKKPPPANPLAEDPSYSEEEIRREIESAKPE